MDTLRVRWQVTPTTTHPSFTSFARGIMASEGLVHGLLLPGLAMNVSAIACCSGVRFALYPHLRDSLGEVLLTDGNDGNSDISGSKTKSPAIMAASGFASGAVGYWVSTPLWALKVQAQAHPELTALKVPSAAVQAASTTTTATITACTIASTPTPLTATPRARTVADLWADGGLKGVFRGATPLVVRGACLSAGNMLGYDGTKTWFKTTGTLPDGALLHVIASVVSAGCATLLGAPADNAMTLVQTAKQRAASTAQPVGVTSRTGSLTLCIVGLVKERGLIGTVLVV
jgi:hypothetical protein